MPKSVYPGKGAGTRVSRSLRIRMGDADTDEKAGIELGESDGPRRPFAPLIKWLTGCARTAQAKIEAQDGYHSVSGRTADMHQSKGPINQDRK